MREKNFKSFIMLLLIVATGYTSYAQRTISGVVKDADGNTLPGATVVVQGTTRGTTTDIDGNFSIQLQANDTEIEVSFIGFISQIVNVEGLDFVEVVLMSAVEQLDEVVVTALGIKREAKALGYSVQQVDAEALSNASRISPLTGLAGQVAGLQIAESGSGAGGSSRILIRGANSLTGSNEPLFVVDGIPIDNSGGSSGGLFGGFDYGNAINNINLDDVESISVLKGGAASALYGARGQNGVIMITTRSGSQREGIGVTYNAMVSSQTPLIKPDFQTNYSQGSGGNFGRLNPRSWGVKMNGQVVNNFLNQSQTLTPVTVHPYDDFFRAAVNIDHSITIDKRDDKNGILFSAAWNQSDGLIRTNEIDKKTFNLRYDSRLAEYLTLDARANYINQTAINRPNLAGSPDNPIYLMTHMPASVSMSQLEQYQTVTGLPVVWNSDYIVNPDGSISLNQADPSFASSPLLQNPYWATELNTNNDTRNRLLGIVSLNIDFREMLNLGFDLELNLKAGLDYIDDQRERITAHNTYYKAEGRASGNWNRFQITEGNYDFLLTAGNQWGDFTLRGSAGGNIMQRKFRGLTSSSESGLINIYGPYVIQNFQNPISTNGISDREIHSLYGLVSMDYRRMVFLDFTWRTDWTSLLALENNPYHYPSVSASWLLEETFELPIYFDMLKLRGSFAVVGSGGDRAGQRYFLYGTTPNQFHGLPYGFFNAIRPFPELEPEFTISPEVGVEAILFGNRLRTDIAYYQTGTRDQIFENPLAPSSGFNTGIINSGFVNNKGIELFTSYRIIDGRDFTWSASANFTRQWSVVEEITEDIDMIVQSSALGASGVRIIAMMGQPAGVIMGSAFARDEQGRILLDSENLPIIKTDENQAILRDNIIGNATPDILWGFSSQLTYRRFFAGFQIDSKLGHDIFSVTNMMGAEFGTLAFTEEGRDDWYRAVELAATDPNINPQDFNMGFMVEGVKNGVEGEYAVDPQRYWARVSQIHEAFIYDASYIRFRQLSLGYNLGRNLLNNTPFREVSLSVFANNLFYIMRNTENISPESSFGTGNNTGFELYAYPEMRSYGVSLRLSL
ncbi:MAG: SusC/RagA family TonB-linked outer membrane protein [Bacteroidetes bacterium]|nr:MAG: SusC/RagA family TonB-linked outer membrane protein [Bacteroidota bacterium]